MRFLILFFVVITFSQYTLAQRVPSVCDVHDTIKFWYQKDASWLSIKELEREGSPYFDSITFPDSLHEKKLRALMAVYNVPSIPEADTVGRLKHIHNYSSLFIDEFNIYADENLSWMKNLKNGLLPSGHDALDSILSLYNIQDYSYDSQSVFGRNRVKFILPIPLNTWALIRELNQLPDIEAVSNYLAGSGSTIRDSVYSDHIELTYSYGWGDCFAGCMYRRYWVFKVYDDCSVQFVESYGSTLPPLGIPKNPTIETWSVFPNPFNNTIEIGNLYEPCDYAFYAVDGRLVKEGTLNGPRITNLDFLPKGLYILHLQAQDSRQVFRISKEN